MFWQEKTLSLATLSGWTFFDEFITAEIVAVSRRYYATSAGFVLCVAQLAKGLVWGSTGSQHDLRHNTGSLSLSARQMHLASFVNVHLPELVGKLQETHIFESKNLWVFCRICQ